MPTNGTPLTQQVNGTVSDHKRIFFSLSLMKQCGMQQSSRNEKEAQLEEVRRALAQDTEMYQARIFASDKMMVRVRELEAGELCIEHGDSCASQGDQKG